MDSIRAGQGRLEVSAAVDLSRLLMGMCSRTHGDMLTAVILRVTMLLRCAKGIKEIICINGLHCIVALLKPGLVVGMPASITEQPLEQPKSAL